LSIVEVKLAADSETREPGTVPITERQAAWATAWVRTFDAVLELYPRSDDGVWNGEEIELATADRVSAAYFEGLLHGRVYAPTEEKLEAIAGAIGLPAKFLGREVAWWEGVRARHRRRVGLEEAIIRVEAERDAERVGRLARELIERFPNKATGSPSTTEQIAAINNERFQRSAEEVRPEDLRAVCEGLAPKPADQWLLVLCEVFGVPFDYWRGEPDHLGRINPLLDWVLSRGSYAGSPDATAVVDTLIDELARREKVILVPDDCCPVVRK